MQQPQHGLDALIVQMQAYRLSRFRAELLQWMITTLPTVEPTAKKEFREVMHRIERDPATVIDEHAKRNTVEVAKKAIAKEEQSIAVMHESLNIAAQKIMELERIRKLIVDHNGHAFDTKQGFSEFEKTNRSIAMSITRQVPNPEQILTELWLLLKPIFSNIESPDLMQSMAQSIDIAKKRIIQYFTLLQKLLESKNDKGLKDKKSAATLNAQYLQYFKHVKKLHNDATKLHGLIEEKSKSLREDEKEQAQAAQAAAQHKEK